jgi:SAM-dependent methyltransferase
MNAHPEISKVRARYARREDHGIYSMLRPEVLYAHAERLQSMANVLANSNRGRLDELTLVDVGCGAGGNLLDFLRLGFRPEKLTGLELLEDRAAVARNALPMAVKIVSGDASQAEIPDGTVDIVFQSVVFSSLLSDEFQQELAEKMWGWLRPGGALLWYDFTYDNPHNSDVRGVPMRRIRQLFPDAKISAKRVTLAPPIARRVVRFGRIPHALLHALPFLRTHAIAWIEK